MTCCMMLDLQETIAELVWYCAVVKPDASFLKVRLSRKNS